MSVRASDTQTFKTAAVWLGRPKLDLWNSKEESPFLERKTWLLTSNKIIQTDAGISFWNLKVESPFLEHDNYGPQTKSSKKQGGYLQLKLKSRKSISRTISYEFSRSLLRYPPFGG